MVTISLLGNPNTGKTTLFNELTDSYAYVGNWTGVTVEEKKGHLRHSNATMVDLPGVYSLNPITKDESVAVNYLIHEQNDLILNITNAHQLRRNLLLTLELLEYGKPVILVLNMIDDLKRTGQTYSLEKLASCLHCQVLATNARNKEGIQPLLSKLGEPADLTELISSQPLTLNYPQGIEREIERLTADLEQSYQMSHHYARWLTIQFMDQNQIIREYARQRNLVPLLARQEIFDANQFDEQLFQTKQRFIDSVLQDALEQLPSSYDHHLTARIDRIVTHPILGLPIFILIFLCMFEFSFDWIGTPLSNLLDAFISGPLSSTTTSVLEHLGAIPFLKSLIVNGIISGVGGVLTFMPQIFILFACISILEDSGYMARAALVTDRLMQSVGLNGKAFIPLVIGFGCNVTGIMAARTIEQPKERLITTLITPFMSCSARLPIYGIFVAAFFQHNQGLILLSIYLLGIIIALTMAKIYQIVLKSTDKSIFIIELPQYHLPQPDIVIQGTWDKGKGFVKKAGTVIFAGTVLIWLLSNLGRTGIVTNISTSYSADIGRLLLPLFTPIGVSSWQVVSSLLTGVLAKEVIGSSMIVLFHLSGQTSLIATFSTLFSPLSAYTLLIFILLYVPCFATLATIKAETGSLKWTIYSALSSLMIAYLVAFVIYQVGSLIL